MHPKSPESAVAQTDVVGSTSQLIAAVQSLSVQEFAVTTDNGILYGMYMAAPGKRFIETLTARNATTCKNCAHYPWMAMDALTNPAEALETGHNEIHVDPTIGRQAVVCTDRILDLATREKAVVRPQGDLTTNA